MTSSLQRIMFDNWQELGFVLPKPDRLSFLSKADNNNLKLFVFHPSDETPIAIAKFSRDSERENVIANEYQNLRYLQQVAGVLKASLPRPLFLESVDDTLVFLQSGLKGKRMSEYVHLKGSRDEITTQLTMAADWLMRFQRQTKARTIHLAESDLDQSFIQPIGQFKSKFTTSPEEIRFLDWLADTVRSLSGLEVSLVYGHNDYWAGNILVDDSEIRVIDWADGKSEALPFWDLLFFLSTFVFQTKCDKRTTTIDSVKRTYLELNWFSEMAQATLLRCLKPLELERTQLDALFASFLVHRALKEPYWRDVLPFYAEHHESFFR